MRISMTKEMAPITKESHTVSLNFSKTGTFHTQLSPKSPRAIFPSQPKKPMTGLVFIWYVADNCSIHSSYVLLAPPIMDFWRAMFSM